MSFADSTVRTRVAILTVLCALLVAAPAIAGHNAGASYTGCIGTGSAGRGFIYNVAIGDSPSNPCRSGDPAIHLSGGDITSVTTPAAGGLTGGGTANDLTLSLQDSYKLPQVCASGQVAKWNGTTWACGTDNEGQPGPGTTAYYSRDGRLRVLQGGNNSLLTVTLPDKLHLITATVDLRGHTQSAFVQCWIQTLSSGVRVRSTEHVAEQQSTLNRTGGDGESFSLMTWDAGSTDAPGLPFTAEVVCHLTVQTIEGQRVAGGNAMLTNVSLAAIQVDSLNAFEV